MMFNDFKLFSIVFWALALLLVFLVLYEKRLIAFEERYMRALWDKKQELEKVVKTQEEVIKLQNRNIRKLGRALSTQKKINSINLETLRQERLRNNREVKR